MNLNEQNIHDEQRSNLGMLLYLYRIFKRNFNLFIKYSSFICLSFSHFIQLQDLFVLVKLPNQDISIVLSGFQTWNCSCNNWRRIPCTYPNGTSYIQFKKRSWQYVKILSPGIEMLIPVATLCWYSATSLSISSELKNDGKSCWDGFE